MIAVKPEASVEGFCTGMCPEYQLRSRTQHANENSLEVVDPLGQGRSMDKLATKKFERNVGPTAACSLICLALFNHATALCVIAYSLVSHRLHQLLLAILDNSEPEAALRL